jgi:hypothetical protein
MSSSIIPLISLVSLFCLPSIIFGQYGAASYDPSMGQSQYGLMNQQAYNPYPSYPNAASGVGSSYPYTSMNLQASGNNMQQPPMVGKKEKKLEFFKGKITSFDLF